MFDNLVISTPIDFVVIKGDAIQGFKEPTVLAAELVCKRSGFQRSPVAMAAYLDVPIPAGERKVGAICKTYRSIAKLLLDGVKPVWQLGPKHLFVKEIE